LTWWQARERENLEAFHNEGQRRFAEGLFEVARAVAEQSGPLALGSRAALFDALVRTSPLLYVVIEQNGERRLQTKSAPKRPLEASSPQGIRQSGTVVLKWGQVQHPGSPGKLNLWIAADTQNPPHEEALRRMRVTHAVAFGAAAALILALILWTRSRALSVRLRLERIRSEHLEEFGLSAAGLAHEIKNPLGIISGLAQALAGQEGQRDEVRRQLESIVDEVDRASARIGHFLSYARQKSPEIGSVDLSGFTLELASLLQSEFAARRQHLELELGVERIQADRELLRQIVINLLLNSLHASQPGRTVLLRVEERGSGAAIIIRDQGCGIDPELLPRVCKPYVSARPGGHGLGLAIVQRAIDSLGWKLEIQSHTSGSQRGTSIEITGIARGSNKQTQASTRARR
jgi:two-component system sensor histidine kinase HydH